MDNPDEELEAPVLLADDGELDDVREQLQALDVPFENTWARGAHRGALLITSPRHADCASPRGEHVARFHIVVAEELSRSVVRQLRRSGCHFVVRSSAHPTALRLLIQHALYTGPEKRCSDRVAMSAKVKVRAGLRPRTATLVQLSSRGCGIESDHALQRGTGLKVTLPKNLTESRALSLEGRVVGGAPIRGSDGLHLLSIAFRPSGAEAQQTIRKVMAGHAVGAAAMRPTDRDRAPAAPPSIQPASVARAPERAKTASAEKSVEGAERRAAPRKLFKRSVLAAGDGTARTVIGRDLSEGGMRISADGSLEVGDELKLAIHGSRGGKPVVVKALVFRDDGDRGFVLQFRDVSPAMAGQLRHLLESLPALPRSRKGGEPDVVVSEIVEGSAGGARASHRSGQTR